VLETAPKYRLSRLFVYEYRCMAALWQPSQTLPEPEKMMLIEKQGRLRRE
jgi:hypothetical protein